MSDVVKKIGRPSKQEILEREQAKIKEDNALKEQLKDTLGFPIFKYGDTVKRLKSTLITDYNPLGTVTRQDIDSQFVLVSWYDGTKIWVSSHCIEITENPKTKKKKLKKEK